MNKPVLQFGGTHIGEQYCKAVACSKWLLALFINKLYNVNVSTVSNDAKSLFISVLKGRLGTEGCFWQLTVETAEPSFLIGIKR